MKTKNLIFISNNFGFGPLSRTHSIANEILKLGSDLRVRVVTDGSNNYLFKDSRVNFDNISNLRDKSSIATYLNQYDSKNTVIVSVMNRFAISAAKNMGFHTILVDGLYWFWINRPKEYDLSDFQIRIVLPWQVEEITNSKDIRYFANPSELPAEPVTRLTNEIDFLITLNGFITPFYKNTHDSYLKFLAIIANSLSKDYRVALTVNKKIYDKVSKLLDAEVKVLSLGKSEYLDTVLSSRNVLLNGGSNSFLEALSLRKNFLFTLPSNQSQYALISKVSQHIDVPITSLCPMLRLFSNHQRILELGSEEKAIDYWSQQIDRLLSDNKSMDEIRKISRQKLPHPEFVTKLTPLYEYADNSIESTRKIAEMLVEMAPVN